MEELVREMGKPKPNEVPNFLVFGASGAIGSACIESLSSVGHVIEGSRNLGELEEKITSVPFFSGVI
jgi:hypothetical protein